MCLSYVGVFLILMIIIFFCYIWIKPELDLEINKSTDKQIIPNLEDILSELYFIKEPQKKKYVAYFAGGRLYIDNIYEFDFISINMNSCNTPSGNIERPCTKKEKYFYSKLYLEYKPETAYYYQECLKFVNECESDPDLNI